MGEAAGSQVCPNHPSLGWCLGVIVNRWRQKHRALCPTPLQIPRRLAISTGWHICHGHPWRTSWLDRLAWGSSWICTACRRCAGSQRSLSGPREAFRDSGRTEDSLELEVRMEEWGSKGTWPARWSQEVDKRMKWAGTRASWASAVPRAGHRADLYCVRGLDPRRKVERETS